MSRPTQSFPPVRRALREALAVLGSTWLGLALLAGIVLFLTVASVLPGEPLENHLDTTELGKYGWWPHRALWVLLCVNVAVATALRVPCRLANLGAWLAHAGVLLLAAGAVWYVTGRVEGDVLLAQDDQGIFRPMNFFHDSHVRALYVAGLDADGQMQTLQTPLPELPLRRPADELSLPVRVADSSVRVRVTGYRPAATVRFAWRDAGLAEYSAARVTVSLGPQRQQFVVPPGELAGLTHGLYLAYLPDLSAQRLEEMLAPAKPAHELTIRVRSREDAPAVIAVVPGQEFAVPDAGYVLRVLEFHPRWQMRSGQRDTLPALSLLIRRTPQGEGASAEQMFHRLVLAGREDLTTDVAPHAAEMPAAGHRLDEDLEILYTHNDSPAAQANLLVLTRDRDAPILVWMSPTGQRGRVDVHPGRALEVPDLPGLGQPLRVTLEEWFTHAVELGELAHTHHADHANAPAVRVEVATGDSKLYQWLPLQNESQFAEPHVLPLPDGRELAMFFGRRRHNLPATLAVEKLTYHTYHASTVPRDYISSLRVLTPDEQPRHVDVRLNEPATVEGFRLSQANWDMESPHWPRYTRLGVASRPGIALVWAGCVLISVSFPWAFWVKPLLRRRGRKDGRP